MCLYSHGTKQQYGKGKKDNWVLWHWPPRGDIGLQANLTPSYLCHMTLLYPYVSPTPSLFFEMWRHFLMFSNLIRHYIENLATVTIWVPDKSGFGMVKTCLMVEWLNIGMSLEFQTQMEFEWLSHLNTWHWSDIKVKEFITNVISSIIIIETLK